MKFVQIAQGLYTATNENRIGLYSYSEGTITLVASTADNGDLWKGIANTLVDAYVARAKATLRNPVTQA